MSRGHQDFVCVDLCPIQHVFSHVARPFSYAEFRFSTIKTTVKLCFNNGIHAEEEGHDMDLKFNIIKFLFFLSIKHLGHKIFY